MPSIRIRNSRYLNIRDVFDDEGNQGSSSSPQAPTPYLRTAQSTPHLRDRPTSLPPRQNAQANETPLMSPMSLRAPDNRNSRRRSNSRIGAHVFSTYRDSTLSRSNQWSTEGQYSSTDVLNPQGTPSLSSSPQSPVVKRPSMVTVEGGQTNLNVAIQGDGGTPGILERKFPENAGNYSARTDPHDEEDHHHDDIVEHLDAIGAPLLSLAHRHPLLIRTQRRPSGGDFLQPDERSQLHCAVSCGRPKPGSMAF